MYFLTICCENRGLDQLCQAEVSTILLAAFQHYHGSGRCYVRLALLMPDHLHALIGIGVDEDLSKWVKDFKRYTSRVAKVTWQRNYIDHRLRHDESAREKADYILHNPVRAGLVDTWEAWPHLYLPPGASR